MSLLMRILYCPNGFQPKWVINVYQSMHVWRLLPEAWNNKTKKSKQSLLEDTVEILTNCLNIQFYTTSRRQQRGSMLLFVWEDDENWLRRSVRRPPLSELVFVLVSLSATEANQCSVRADAFDCRGWSLSLFLSHRTCGLQSSRSFTSQQPYLDFQNNSNQQQQQKYPK